MKLLKNDGNAELLESIILIILSSIRSCPTVHDENDIVESVVQNGVVTDKAATICEIVTAGSLDESLFMGQEILEWLEAFTTISTFRLMVRFFSKQVLLRITQTLEVSEIDSYRDAALKYNSEV